METWRRVIDVNLTGAFICCKAVVPVMVAAGFGLLELRAERLTLEDIFVRLVTTEAA